MLSLYSFSDDFFFMLFVTLSLATGRIRCQRRERFALKLTSY
jgi:hypothetical protein